MQYDGVATFPCYLPKYTCLSIFLMIGVFLKSLNARHTIKFKRNYLAMQHPRS